MYELKKRHIYIAACAPDGGIMRGEISDSGKIEINETAHCDRPMYLSLKGQRLYTLLRKPDEGSPYSGLTYFNITGDLIVCTNENSNNVTVFRKTASGFEKTDDVFAKSPLCVIFGDEAE